MILTARLVAILVDAGLCGAALKEACAEIEAAGLAAVTSLVAGDGLADAMHAAGLGDRRRGRPGNPESAGARRMRAYRARRAAGSRFVTPFVTPSDFAQEMSKSAETADIAVARPEGAEAASVTNEPVPSQMPPVVTICDAVPAKESPPHPHKKTTPPESPQAARRHKSPASAPQRRRRRNAFEAGTPAEDPRVFVPSGTALYRELLVVLGKPSLPDMGTGGWKFTPDEIAKAQQRLDERVTRLPPRRAQAEGVRARASPAVDTG